MKRVVAGVLLPPSPPGRCERRLCANRQFGLLALIAALACLWSAPAKPAGEVEIDELVVSTTMPNPERDATLSATRSFYAFWNTGDESFLKHALADSFVDRTLPPGRPQGPQGPAFASRHFRVAVPDLRVRISKIVVAGSYVTVHMTFTGHFTGRFNQTQGKGQPIAFIATDLLRVENGRITDNWHIEDNLTLLRAMGIVIIAP